MTATDSASRDLRPDHAWLRSRLFLLGSLFIPSFLNGADLDPTQLPPPAPAKVDFARDIKPLLEASCLQCHGTEKARSGFRLDSRDRALVGGDHGVNILPGDSAKSPLAFYVSGLVPDMQMPPSGKGWPLPEGGICMSGTRPET